MNSIGIIEVEGAPRNAVKASIWDASWEESKAELSAAKAAKMQVNVHTRHSISKGTVGACLQDRRPTADNSTHGDPSGVPSFRSKKYMHESSSTYG